MILASCYNDTNSSTTKLKNTKKKNLNKRKKKKKKITHACPSVLLNCNTTKLPQFCSWDNLGRVFEVALTMLYNARIAS